MAVRRRRTAPAEDAVRCFLCRGVIEPRDRDDAYERVLTDSVPSRPDYAHLECAGKAGYFDQPSEEEGRAAPCAARLRRRAR